MKTFTEEDIFTFLELISQDKIGPSVNLAKLGYHTFSNTEKDDVYTSVHDMSVDVMKHFLDFLNSKKQ